MGTADQNIFAALNGVGQDGAGNPNNAALPWRWVRVRGRQILKGLAKTSWGALLPFNWPNPNQAASVSAFDAIAGTAEQTASRFIDPYGNVVNLMTVWVVNWFWMLDGAPTPLPQTRLASYLQLANQLNPWPNNYPGINKAQFPTEDYATYPAWPPASPTPLDAFLPNPAAPNGSNAAGRL